MAHHTPQTSPLDPLSEDSVPNASILEDERSPIPAAPASQDSTRQAQLLNDRFKATRKSRSGCQTCKFRKKKCDDTHPVCRDCRRLGKECVWVDYTSMNKEEIRVLRKKVLETEQNLKLRKRRKVTPAAVEGASKSIGTPSLAREVPLVTPSTILLLLHVHSELDAPPIFTPKRSQLLFSDSINPVTKEVSPVLVTSDLARDFEPNSSAKPSNDPLPFEGEAPFEELSGGYFNRLASLLNLFKAASGHDLESSLAFLHYLKDITHTLHSSPRLEATVQGNTSDSGAYTADYGQGATPSVCQEDLHAKLCLLPLKTPPEGEFYFNGLHLFDVASGFMSGYSPSPQPSLSLLPELSPRDLYLYNYYCETVSRKVSIAPTTNVDSNSYQRVFLPLAHRDKGVLYGILAWAGFHLGGKWLIEGTQYAKLAARHLNDSSGGYIENESELGASNSVTMGTCLVDPLIDRGAIVNKLATLLILCGAEICRGDIKYWSIFLKWGANLLKTNGGIMNFNNNKEEHWLISNFAYHDLLASSTVDRGTYFPTEVYSEIFTDRAGISKGNMNPLLGVSKSLFKAIGEISQLWREAKSGDVDTNHELSRTIEPVSLDETLELGSARNIPKNYPLESRVRVFTHISLITKKALRLEKTIEALNPEPEDLEPLSQTDLELQLTTFEALKLACKLYLRQAVFRINPSALQSQVLCSELIDRIDVLLHTSVQATLVFPIFMAGIHCVSIHEQELMRLRFENFMKSYGPWNIVRVKSMVERVWMTNCMGEKAVDWNAMLNEMGWEVNFA